MRELKRKILSLLIVSLIILSSIMSFAVPKAGAITADQLSAAISTIQKLRSLSQTQAQQAISIASEVVNQVGTDSSWLSSSEIEKLKAKGLTKAEVIAAIDAVSAAVAGDAAVWSQLTNDSMTTQLTAAASLINNVMDALGVDFISSLKAKGIGTEELVIAVLDLANVQISAWDNLPQAAIETIFDNYAPDINLSQSTAASYGLNWQNVKEILDSLSSTQRDQLKSILVAIGSWKTTGGGGGGGGDSGGVTDKPATPVSDSAVNSSIAEAAKTGKVTLVADSGKNEVAVTATQLQAIQATDKPMEVKFGAVSILVPTASLQLDTDIAQVQFQAKPVAPEQVSSILAQANNGGLFSLAGDVFELSAEAVTKNGAINLIKQFNGKIKISLPVPEKAKALAAQGKLTVCYYNEETKAWQDMSGEYDPASGTISFETDHFSKYAVMEVKVQAFTDIANHWARADIEFMASKKFSNGVGNGLFAPEANITRAQFATLLVRILGVPDSAGALNFTDVKAGDWYYNTLAAAYSAGLLKGVSADKLAPNDNITREQMAVMLVRAMEYKGKTIPAAMDLTFADKATVSDWAAASVSQASQLALIGGFPDGTFGSRASATRAQAIVMLRRVYNQIQ